MRLSGLQTLWTWRPRSHRLSLCLPPRPPVQVRNGMQSVRNERARSHRPTRWPAPYSEHGFSPTGAKIFQLEACYKYSCRSRAKDSTVAVDVPSLGSTFHEYSTVIEHRKPPAMTRWRGGKAAWSWLVYRICGQASRTAQLAEIQRAANHWLDINFRFFCAIFSTVWTVTFAEYVEHLSLVVRPDSLALITIQ